MDDFLGECFSRTSSTTVFINVRRPSWSDDGGALIVPQCATVCYSFVPHINGRRQSL
jgi:hypothetical protein